MENKKENITKGIVLLIILTFFIATDIGIRVFRDNSILINEKVKFGSFTNDRTLTFNIESTKLITLETNINIEGGEISISIINPNNEVVYENNKSNPEKIIKKLSVYQGIWSYRVKCEDAQNGEYSILCKAE